jgi:DNA-binding transcriptional ArsR family regulator
MAPRLASPPADLTEVFKALADPVRWTMVVEMARVDEFPAADLNRIVPVSKPTISYHVKVLYHAGLLEVRKEGRNFFYRLRRDVVREVIAQTTQKLGLEAAAKRRPRRA